MFIKPARAALPLAFAMLAACSSGGGDSTPVAVTPTAEKALLPLVTSAGVLQTVDPADPAATPVSLDSGLSVADGGSAFRRLLGGTLIGTNFTLSNGHYPAVVYLKQGRVKRASLLKGGNPAPVLVSSVTNACRIRTTASDYANTLHSRMLIETAGSDGVCSGDNAAVWLRVDADVLDGGQSVSLAEFLIRDTLRGTDGSLQGVMVAEGPSSARVLKRYDADLQNPVTVANLSPDTSADPAGPRYTRTKSYARMHVDGESDPCLYRYDWANNVLSGCLHPIQSSSWPLANVSEADASHLYLADGGQVLRIGHTESTTTPLFDGSPSYGIMGLWLSANRVVINGYHGGSMQYVLLTIPRAPVSPLDPPVPGVEVGAANPISLRAVAGSWVYYTLDTGGGFTQATRALEDGSNTVSVDYADWGGFSWSTTRASVGLTELYKNPDHGVLGVMDPNTYDVSIASLDADSGEPLQQLGSIYLAVDSLSHNYGRYRLAEITVYRPNPGAYDTDVYFVDTLGNGSLRPIADTAGEDDKVVF